MDFIVTALADLPDLIRSKMDLGNTLGLIGGLFYISTMFMKTMVPLRVSGIASNAFFIFYGLLTKSLPTFFLYLILLPINCVRLYQMLQLVKKVKAASQGSLSMDWLKPFMTKRSYQSGQMLFRKGDVAAEMFFTVTGRFKLVELDIELQHGHVVGEMGLLAPDNRRTGSMQCVEDGTVLSISYDKVRELYFQNPAFGFYFLRLTTERLMQNIARLEKVIEQNKLAVPDSAPMKAIGKPAKRKTGKAKRPAVKPRARAVKQSA